MASGENPHELLLSIYKKLLYLYPKQYRDDYGEQLVLTANDMLEDTSTKAGRRALWTHILFDTLVSATKEHYVNFDAIIAADNQATAKNQQSKKRLLMFGLAVTAVVVSLLLLAQPASSIPPLSSLNTARTLSQGTKNACLTNDNQAAERVHSDDAGFTYAGITYSNFEATASSGIADVPAGTNYQLTIASYDGKLAKGTITYDGNYGTYDYIIKKLPGAGNWNFVSMVACGDNMWVPAIK